VNPVLERKLFGIYAHPVHHSLSPTMHNAAFSFRGLTHNYQAFDVHPTGLEQAMEAMKALQIGGINVSIPHKEKVMQYLDEIDEEAQVIGAVNTVVLDKNNRLKGFNTDGAGYVQSLLTETAIKLQETDVLLIGAGGAAKGIAVYLLKNGCASVTITNRTESKAKELVLLLQKYVATNQNTGAVAKVHIKDWDDAVQAHGSFGLIVNTTPMGMWPDIERVPFQLHSLNASTIVSDIVYNPLQTRFLKDAEEQGATVHQGVGMFIYQGALAFELFTGQKAPIEVMRKVVLENL
jgi:shikimate dehydrogenase